MIKVTNAEKIRRLKQARTYFAKQPALEYRGLCSAICWVELNKQGSNERARAVSIKLKVYIARQLGKFNYLESWLAYNRPGLNQDPESMKQYRLQWLDWMIACCEQKEKSK